MALKDFLVAQGDLRGRLYNIDQQRKKDAYDNVLRQINLNQLKRGEEIAKIEHTYNKAISEFKSNNVDFLIEAEETRQRLDNVINENNLSSELLKKELYPNLSQMERDKANFDRAFLSREYVDKVFKQIAPTVKAQITSKYVDEKGNINLGAAKKERDMLLKEVERLDRIDTDEAKVEAVKKRAELMAFDTTLAELNVLNAKLMKTKATQSGVNGFDLNPERKNKFKKTVQSFLDYQEDQDKATQVEGQPIPTPSERIIKLGSQLNDENSNIRKEMEMDYPQVVDYVEQNYDGNFIDYITAIFGGEKPLYKFGSDEDPDFKRVEMSGSDIIDSLKAVDGELVSIYNRIGKDTSTNPYKIMRKIGNKLDNKNSTEYKNLEANYPVAVEFIEKRYGKDRAFTNYISELIENSPYFESIEAKPDNFEANFYRDAVVEQLSSFEHSLTSSVSEADVVDFYNSLSEEERIEVTDNFGEKVKDTLFNKISRQYEDEGIVASGITDMIWQKTKQRVSGVADFLSSVHLDDSIVSDDIIKANDGAMKPRVREIYEELMTDAPDGMSDDRIAEEVGKRLYMEFGEQTIKNSSYGSLVFTYPEPNPDWEVNSETYYQYLLNKNTAGAITPEERKQLKDLSFKRNFLGTLPGQKKNYLSRPLLWESVRKINNNKNSYISINNKLSGLRGVKE